MNLNSEHSFPPENESARDRYLRIFHGTPDWEPIRELPDKIPNRFFTGFPKHNFYGLKIEVDERGRPTLWSETSQINPEDLFEWLLEKEVITSVDGRGLFDSIFKVLDTKQVYELAMVGKTSYRGILLSIPGHSPWLSVRKGNKTGKLTNLHNLFSLDKEFGDFTQPSHFRQGAELAHVRLWNAGLGDLAVRSPGQLIESIVIRKVKPVQYLPEDIHVQRFANAFKPGRIEGTTFGINEVKDYDISAAFPSVISELVDLNQITWIDTPKMQDEAIYAAAKCNVEINQTLIRGPISVRFGENSSFFPIGLITNVWLGKPEIDLLRDFPEIGKITKIHEASWGYITNHSQAIYYPFRRLLRHNLYDLRRNDKFLAGFIKLSMAALWGKFISSYNTLDTLDGEKYTRSSALYNPVFAAHVTSSVRSSLYRTSLGKEVVGEFVDGIALIDSVRTQTGFGGLSIEGSGPMVLFDDQYKGCDWKNPEVLYWAENYKDRYYFEMPREYRASLPYAYAKGGSRARHDIGRLEQTMQHIPIGPSRRLMDAYRVGDFLNYSLPSAPPRMSDLQTILYQRAFDRKMRP